MRVTFEDAEGATLTPVIMNLCLADKIMVADGPDNAYRMQAYKRMDDGDWSKRLDYTMRRGCVISGSLWADGEHRLSADDLRYEIFGV